MKLFCALAVCVSALAIAAPAHAGGPTMSIGITDEAFRTESLAEAKANMTMARLLGADSIRISSTWSPGENKPSDLEFGILGNVSRAAKLTGLRVFCVVMNFGNRTTPLTDEDQRDFAAYAAAIARRIPYFRAFVVGNEPNINRFWLPQFNEEDGSDVAAPAYLRLLTRTYDALKAVSPSIRVIGGALSPRGSDRFPSDRHTHSPTTFLLDMGAAYRESGRRRPIMDALSIHPYQDNSSQPPTTKHAASKTIAIADYGKLIQILGQAFDGTPQLGSTLPIYYMEYGVESAPPPGKAGLYVQEEPSTTRPVSAQVQARYYRQAMQIAYCQPTVQAFMVFLLGDEPQRPRWQSGLYYIDRTPKPSAATIPKAVQEARRGVLAHCRGLELTPRALKISWPRARITAGKPLTFRLRCSLDCSYTAQVVTAAGRPQRAGAKGRLVAKQLKRIAVRGKLRPGAYRLIVTLVAPVNPGPPKVLRSRPFSVLKPR